MSNARRPWLVLGNPANRRIALFQAALAERRQPPAEVVAWSGFLRGAIDWETQLAALDRQCGFLRIESPGENHAVERLLIARGASGIEGELSAAAALRLRDDPGRVRAPRQWLAGFSAVMTELESQLARFPNVTLQNSPAAIGALFDKTRCHALLAERGVAVPRALPPIANYDQLREAMRSLGLPRVFVKLNGSSSSSGVVAFNAAGARAAAITSLEIVRRRGEARFYNNLRLSRYDRERDLRTIFDFLCGEGAHIEEWLPKAVQGDRQLDLRVVTIAGEPQQMVVRTSRSPITNLHLGNRRGDLAALRRAAGKRWQLVTDICHHAAEAFSEATYVGWDVLVTPGFRRACILEGNAFGDLLPGVTYRGRSTYSAAIAATMRRARSK